MNELSKEQAQEACGKEVEVKFFIFPEPRTNKLPHMVIFILIAKIQSHWSQLGFGEKSQVLGMRSFQTSSSENLRVCLISISEHEIVRKRGGKIKKSQELKTHSRRAGVSSERRKGVNDEKEKVWMSFPRTVHRLDHLVSFWDRNLFPCSSFPRIFLCVLFTAQSSYFSSLLKYNWQIK